MKDHGAEKRTTDDVLLECARCDLEKWQAEVGMLTERHTETLGSGKLQMRGINQTGIDGGRVA